MARWFWQNPAFFGTLLSSFRLPFLEGIRDARPGSGGLSVVGRGMLNSFGRRALVWRGLGSGGGFAVGRLLLVVPRFHALREERDQVDDLGGLLGTRHLLALLADRIYVTRFGARVNQRQQVLAIVVTVLLGLPFLDHAAHQLFGHVQLFARDAQLLEVLLGELQITGATELVREAQDEER